MARRKELGCFANKALTLNCFSTKIKCGDCGRSFVRDKRRNKANKSQFGEYDIFWECTTHKRGRSTCKSGTIREQVLKEECAKVLGLTEFDEEVFSEKVKQITIPETGTLIFEMIDGQTIEHHWERHFKRDFWTPERKAAASIRRRQKDTNLKRGDFKPFTGFLKCACCGKNYRHQGLMRKDGTDGSYWHCPAVKPTCDNLSIKDSIVRSMVCDILHLDSFDEAAMDAAMDYATVDHEAVTFHFRDGHTETRTYKKKKHGTPHTAKYKAYMSEVMKKQKGTLENRKATSERMKKLRSDKYWNSRKK